MSLLKWKEIAKQKSELGNKINFVHDTITNKKLGEKTSQLDYEKMFKPITKLLEKENPKKKKEIIEEDYYEGLEDYLEDDFGDDIQNVFEYGDYAKPYKTAVPKIPQIGDEDEDEEIPEDFGEEVFPEQENKYQKNLHQNIQREIIWNQHNKKLWKIKKYLKNIIYLLLKLLKNQKKKHLKHILK